MTNVTNSKGNSIVIDGKGLNDQYEIIEIPYSQNITAPELDYTGVICVSGVILFLGLVFIILWYKAQAKNTHGCLQNDRLASLEQKVISIEKLQKQKLDRILEILEKTNEHN